LPVSHPRQFKESLIKRLTTLLRIQQLVYPFGSGKASCVGREDPLCIALHNVSPWVLISMRYCARRCSVHMSFSASHEAVIISSHNMSWIPARHPVSHKRLVTPFMRLWPRRKRRGSPKGRCKVFTSSTVCVQTHSTSEAKVISKMPGSTEQITTLIPLK
jgi:hypothetical protein